MREQDERDLRTALREEAERHQPDREVIRERVAKGRAEHARTPMQRAFALMRPAAAALAVAVMLVLGIAGARLADSGSGVDDTPVAAAPTVAVPPQSTALPAPSIPASSAPSSTAPSSTAPSSSIPGSSGPVTSAPAGSPTGGGTATTRPPADPTSQDFLSSTGALGANSGDGWTEDGVTLHATKKITALDVTVTAALTAGVTETGKFTTAPANLIAMTVTRRVDTLEYRFTLRDGASLPAGSYVFAGQFTHPGKRSAAADTYTITATGAGKDVRVSGGFGAR